MEDLARHSGATVRTIRAYQDRGLLPRPGRRGRANLYDDSHLTRLRQISALLERGYTLASIKELLAAWDEGRGLSGVLGLVSEVERPWSEEVPERLSLDELDGLFGKGSARSEDAVAEAVELGVLVPLPERPGEFLVPSPQELAVAAELHRAGVPLLALTGHLRELRAQVEHIAARFMDFTGQHIFGRCPQSGPTDEEASEAAGLVRRLRPLAKQTVDAELARAMRTFASRSLREHLRQGAYGAEGEG
ncbi:MerR family transcriptional regulator, partial [Streptomyces nanshensis]